MRRLKRCAEPLGLGRRGDGVSTWTAVVQGLDKGYAKKKSSTRGPFIIYLDKVSQTLPPPPHLPKKEISHMLNFWKSFSSIYFCRRFRPEVTLPPPFLQHSSSQHHSPMGLSTSQGFPILCRSVGCVRVDSLQKDVCIPIYFACKAKSNIYLAFWTVASTWANKIQGKFIDNGSKKASDIPLSSSFPSIIFLTLPWLNNRNRKLGQPNSPMKFSSSFTFQEFKNVRNGQNQIMDRNRMLTLVVPWPAKLLCCEEVFLWAFSI